MNFTEEQKSAVESAEDQIRLSASPGSGKTSVIVGRLVHLLSQGVKPEQILVLCFAKHDKSTVLGRISKYLPFPVVNRLQINNYHGFGLNLIRTFGIYGRSGREIKLLEETESYALIKKGMEDLYQKTSSSNSEAEFLFSSAKKLGVHDAIFHIFNTVRDDFFIPLTEIRKAETDPKFLGMKQFIAKTLKKLNDSTIDLTSTSNEFHIDDYNLIKETDVYSLAEEYGGYCEKHGYIDFIDMILQSYLILKNNPELGRIVSGKIEHLLVDEFQDISSLQFELVSTLSSVHNRIFGVGDLDQAIYEWRNAKTTIMKDKMPERYPRLVTYPLSINFRSDANIVKAASELIINNVQRLDVTMKPFHPATKPICFRRTMTMQEQANEIATLIKAKLGSRDNYYTEQDHKIAIIMRSGKSESAAKIRNALFRNQIPVKIRFESAIVEKIMTIVCSLCNLTVDPSSPIDVVTILSILPGFGDKTLSKIKSELASGTLVQLLDRGALPGTKLDLVKKFNKYIQELSSDFKSNENISISGMKFFSRDFNIIDFLRGNFTTGKGALENTGIIDATIDEIKNNTEKFIDYRDTLTAGLSVLNHLEQGKKPSVLLCTAHHSKGCEFDIVICPDFVQGASGFPIGKNSQSEEERRIAYVSITRAKKELFLYSYANDDRGNPYVVSPYVREMALFPKPGTTNSAGVPPAPNYTVKYNPTSFSGNSLFKKKNEDK